jgi:hypothetical protein
MRQAFDNDESKRSPYARRCANIRGITPDKRAPQAAIGLCVSATAVPAARHEIPPDKMVSSKSYNP